jgi:Fe-S cluster assembly protein SufD
MTHIATATADEPVATKNNTIADPQTHAECVASAISTPWLDQLRSKAWESFLALPDPARNHEKWRFSDLQKLSYAEFSPGQAVDAAAAEAIGEQSQMVDASAAIMVFANDHLVRHAVTDDNLANSGVIISPLADAWTEHSALVEKYFMEQDYVLGSAKFAALHSAYVRNGAFVYVPADVSVAGTIELHYWMSGNETIAFPHSLIVLEPGAKATVVEVFHSHTVSDRQLSLVCSDLHAATGATLNHRSIQILNGKSTCIHLLNAIAEKDSVINTVALNLGGSYHRAENHVRITGAGSKVDMDSLTIAAGDQEFDQRTLQTHSAPGAVSDLLFKNALLDNARTIFSGLIKVEPNAQQTDAYQTNRNLLLNPTAEANALPGLEIEANDVKCSHGATTGRLDTSELFYMLSRGIPQREAYQLLVFGFFEEVLEKLGDDPIADVMRNLIHDTFNSHNA